MPTTFMLTEKIRGNQPALLDCSTCPDDVIGMHNNNSYQIQPILLHLQIVLSRNQQLRLEAIRM